MAETAAAGKGLGETLKRKVGPFPLGVWAAGGIAAVWYFRKQQGKTGPGGSAANGTTQTGYGTDPAGNTGYIDPSTGYVYGSAEDVAALQSQGLVGAPATGSSSGTGASGSSDAGGGGGTTPSGTPTTTPGAPGDGSGGAPTTTPPPASTSKNWRYPAPGGLAASAVSDSGFSLSWQPVKGPSGQKPSGYTVQTLQENGKKVDQFTTSNTATKEYGAGGKGLHPGWRYKVSVWANGGPQAPSHASIVVTVKPKGSK